MGASLVSVEVTMEQLIEAREKLCDKIACHDCPFKAFYGTETYCGATCMSVQKFAQYLKEMLRIVKGN